MSFFAIIGILFCVSLPIVAWGYIFSYFGGLQFGGRKFVLGIIAGALAVLPILYAPDIFNKFEIQHFISTLSTKESNVFELIGSLVISIFFPIVIFTITISLMYFSNIREYFKKLGILAFVVTAILASIILFMTLFSGNDSGRLDIKGMILQGFPVIVAFYIFVAGLEEILKHLGIYSSKSLSTDSKKEVLLVAVYIALGFVFLENLLYLSGGYNRSGFNSSFFGLLFSRSIISLLLHVFATLLLTVGFYAWLKKSNTQNSVIYFKYFLFALFAHAIFNIAITYNTTWILPIYGIIGYFFITGVFFREEYEE